MPGTDHAVDTVYHKTVRTMPISFEKAFSVHDDSMVMWARRSSILASNIANADTPNYKARDVDFQSLLRGIDRSQATNLKLAGTHARHIQHTAASLEPELKYRNPLHASLDGNTVDSHIEQSKFAENALRYQVSFTLLNGKIRGLMNALKGE